MEFRTLRADEIECRINTISAKGCSLLLYKDARADMILLDETVGPENWQRNHELINGNLFCNVGIKIDNEWIWKQDVGKESYTEAEKGQASDAFKRACVNWGIGRELYTSPCIWIGKENVNLEDGNGKKKTNDSFSVKDIQYNDRREIVALTIVNNKRRKVVYRMGETIEEEITNTPQAAAIEEASAKAKVIAYITKRGWDKAKIDAFCRNYKVASPNEMTLDQCNHYINYLKENGVDIDE